MKFFRPIEGSYERLAKHLKGEGQLVYEVGCGEGHVLNALTDLGLCVIGIEVRDDFVEELIMNRISDLKEPLPILPMCGMFDATYPEDSVVLMVRPCHGQFVMGTYRRAIREHGAKAFFYVGLEKNLEIDFDDSVKLELLEEDLGEENEKMWRVTCV
jgi:hypothetical protein